MCIGDWRLGRVTRTVVTSFNTGTGVGLTYPPNMQRVAISFGISAAVFTILSGLTVSVGGVLFLNLNANFPYKHFTILDHGDLPTKQFVLAASGANQVGAVIEWFLPERYLQAALESFESEYKL